MLDVETALKEIRSKSELEIEHETAYKWASRAIACYVMAAKEPKNKASWLRRGDDNKHEALEHAALVEDGGKLVGTIEKAIKTARPASK